MEGLPQSSSNKEIAVVTGGNKGIGLEICKQLGSSGVRVVLTARDEARGLEAVQKLRDSGISDAIFHRLDVNDGSSIASFAEFLKVEFGKLDILVNNAGVAGIDADFEGIKSEKPDENRRDTGEVPEWLQKHLKETYQGAEACMKTNYYGTKAVTKALIPLLQLSNSGRIVIISSSIGLLRVLHSEELRDELSDIDNLTEERLDELADSFLEDFKHGRLEEHGWPAMASAYKVSKVLVNAYTRILARKHAALPVNSICPGFVKTDINFNSGILTVEEGAKGPVMLALGHHGNSTGQFYRETEVSTFDK